MNILAVAERMKDTTEQMRIQGKYLSPPLELYDLRILVSFNLSSPFLLAGKTCPPLKGKFEKFSPPEMRGGLKPCPQERVKILKLMKMFENGPII
jgi:hypothetical protein